MYKANKFRIKKKDTELYVYCQEICHKYKNMYNVTNFYIRQVMTGIKKPESERQPNERKVLEMVEKHLPGYNKIKYNTYLRNKAKAAREGKSFTKKIHEVQYPTPEHWFMNDNFIDAIMKLSDNPDYRNMPTQVSYEAIKECAHKWIEYFDNLKGYKINPEKYSGCPHIPKYRKGNMHTAKFSNQSCRINEDEGKKYVKFPKTDAKLWLEIELEGRLKSVEIKPIADHFMISVIMEIPDQEYPDTDKKRIIGMDLGVDNFATIANNYGEPSILVKGNVIKSYNQWYNKEAARLKSVLTKGHESNKGQKSSKRIQNLWAKRDRFMTDYMHKISANIIRYCVENKVGTIIIGKNDGWKQNANMGKKNNQTFVQIPYEKFLKQLTYKAKCIGIKVIEREESYTSKASFLDMDEIPTYGEDVDVQFSGKRVKRGLYRSKDGIQINADINGSGNIIRKEIPDAFSDMEDVSYIRKTISWNSEKWYKCKAAGAV